MLPLVHTSMTNSAAMNELNRFSSGPAFGGLIQSRSVGWCRPDKAGSYNSFDEEVYD